MIGETHVQQVATEHVLQILRPIWTAKTETAPRVRGLVKAVLDVAKVLRWREGENRTRRCSPATSLGLPLPT